MHKPFAKILLIFYVGLLFFTLTSSGSPELLQAVPAMSSEDAVFEPTLPVRAASEVVLWWANIRPETENPWMLAWSYRPQTLDETPAALNCLAPTWFYVEADESGKPVVKTVPELGRSVDFEQYVSEAHRNDIAVWGTVVSAEQPELTGLLIHDPVQKQAFIERMAQLAQRYRLDGINIDFEKMDPAHTDDYTQFVADCAAAWRPLGFTVSVDVNVETDLPDPNNWYQCFNRKELAKVVDYVALMSYDQHLKSSNEAGPVADIDWVEHKLLLLLEEVPSDKILLGVPCYGRDFPAFNDELHSPAWLDGSAGVKTMYKQDIELILNDGEYSKSGKVIEVAEWLVPHAWNEDSGTYYLEFLDQDGLVHQIWYDEEASLALKARLVKKYNLAGVAAWNHGQGRDSFWLSMAEVLR